MKIYSDYLETEDLTKTCPMDCDLEYTRILHPRKAKSAWTVYLSCPTGHRWTNRQGAAERTRAASWDQWGIWIADLFELDPGATIGVYDGISQFHRMTSNYIPKGMRAPWLSVDYANR